MIFSNEVKTRLILVFFIVLILTGTLLFLYSIYMHRRLVDSYQFFFQQWKSQKIDNYVLEYNNNGCVYTIKVNKGMPKVIRENAVVPTFNNTYCEFKPLWLSKKQPMNVLFSDLMKFKPHCGPNGCICDNINYLKIKFDKKLGYIKSWKEINSGNFTPYTTADFSLAKACTLMYTEHLNFIVNIRPVQ